MSESAALVWLPGPPSSAESQCGEEREVLVLPGRFELLGERGNSMRATDKERANILAWESFISMAEMLVAQARRQQHPLSVLAIALHQSANSGRKQAELMDP